MATLKYNVAVQTTYDEVYTDPEIVDGVSNENSFPVTIKKAVENSGILWFKGNVTVPTGGVEDILVFDDEATTKAYTHLVADSNNTDAIKVYIYDQDENYLAFGMLDPGASMYLPVYVYITASSGNYVALKGECNSDCNIFVCSAVDAVTP